MDPRRISASVAGAKSGPHATVNEGLAIRKQLDAGLHRLRALEGTPHSLALGTAVGVAFAILPVLPFRTILVLATAFCVRANAVAAVVTATLLANPLVLPLWYASAIWLGSTVAADPGGASAGADLLASIQSAGSFRASASVLVDAGLRTIVMMLVGGAILAVPLGLSTYPVAYRAFRRWRDDAPEADIEQAP
ncbi:MAG: DUF2062 domain-containing protein [Pseudomonadota bacterium]